LKKVIVILLSTLMILSTFVSPAFARESKLTNDELASLALPIVQSYEADSNYSTWTMDETTRFVIPDTEEYKENDRLRKL